MSPITYGIRPVNLLPSNDLRHNQNYIQFLVQASQSYLIFGLKRNKGALLQVRNISGKSKCEEHCWDGLQSS